MIWLREVRILYRQLGHVQNMRAQNKAQSDRVQVEETSIVNCAGFYPCQSRLESLLFKPFQDSMIHLHSQATTKTTHSKHMTTSIDPRCRTNPI